MKKSIMKTLSAVLALVLILSALPMTAFAAETVAPAAAVCTHPLCYTTIGVRCESYGDSEYHKSYEIQYDTCASCGVTIETVLSVTEEAHLVETWTLSSYNADYLFYEGECMYCNEELLLILSRG